MDCYLGHYHGFNDGVTTFWLNGLSLVQNYVEVCPIGEFSLFIYILFRVLEMGEQLLGVDCLNKIIKVCNLADEINGYRGSS